MKAVYAKHLKTLSEKRIGMLGMKKAEPVYFCTRFGIHTFGMKFPIDVVILDNDWRVTSFVSSLNPNRVFFWNPLFKHVLELPSGWVVSNRAREGDIIRVVYH